MRRRTSAPDTYRRLAEEYDTVYGWKQYRRESDRIRQIVRRTLPAGRPTLLDVGCGTGGHLRHFRRWSRATGLDASGPMLAIARRRLPDVTFVRGRMESFRLGRRYDVITCLFSAIGYVRTGAALRRTLATFARHLADGGVVVVEPWIEPDRFRDRTVHVATAGPRTSRVVRVGHSVRRGGRSVLTMHYVAAGPAGIRHWSEVHDMGLFDRPTMRSAFAAAGLRARRIPSGFQSDRGLWVAVRLADATGRRRPAAPIRRR